VSRGKGGDQRVKDPQIKQGKYEKIRRADGTKKGSTQIGNLDEKPSKAKETNGDGQGDGQWAKTASLARIPSAL